MSGLVEQPRIEVRRGADRFVTDVEGRTTRHSFSFDRHYDPANVEMGFLVCHNDDLVQPGFGYDDHPHRNLEIVTWVLSGALSHRDDAGRSGVVTPRRIQVMSAGDGVVHSEVVEPGAGPTRFVQTWVLPDEPGGAPSYASAAVNPGDTWLPVASGSRTDAATRIGTRAATLWVADLVAGQSLEVPDAPRVHLFVATGSAALSGAGDRVVDLGTADAVRLTGEGGLLTAMEPSQLMAWTFTNA